MFALSAAINLIFSSVPNFLNIFVEVLPLNKMFSFFRLYLPLQTHSTARFTGPVEVTRRV